MMCRRFSLAHGSHNNADPVVRTIVEHVVGVKAVARASGAPSRIVGGVDFIVVQRPIETVRLHVCLVDDIQAVLIAELVPASSFKHTKARLMAERVQQCSVTGRQLGLWDAVVAHI